MKIKSILVSQPQPAEIEKTPYGAMMKTYGVNFTFEKFIKLEDVTASELRQEHIKLPEYTAIILTSKSTVDHFFRVAKEMRYTVPDELKYFCINEQTAHYLQNYVQYRKRKIFFGNQTFDELVEVIKKHKDEKFLYCCSDIASESTFEKLNAVKIDYTKAVLFRTVSADLSETVKIDKYDMLVFFSPAGIESLKTNFPDFQQGEVAIGGFGAATCKAIVDAGFKVDFQAPTETAPSITKAIEEYVKVANKRKR